MGNTAENIDNEKEEIKDDATEAETKVEAEVKAEGISEELQELDDNGEPIVKESPEEFEVVREGTQPQNFDQQQVNDIVSKRVKKLNSKVQEVNEQSHQAQTDLDIANNKNKILQIALDQAKEKAVTNQIVKPNKNDFDNGEYDPEFIKQSDEYTQALIDQRVEQAVLKASQTTEQNIGQEQQQKALLSKQVKHYERADKIGAKDYSDTEDVALGIFGNHYSNQIIENFDDSHIIMYYLGKNPEEARNLKSLIENSPVKGVAAIGKLSAELKLKPKQKNVADPDTEINGDGSGSNSDALQRQLDKLRDQAAVSGNMTKLMNFKKANKLQ
tara:strand:+ start:1857 stop:2843 length:987 start_codon:yes stop_codon:yes gene_type:complete